MANRFTESDLRRLGASKRKDGVWDISAKRRAENALKNADRANKFEDMISSNKEMIFIPGNVPSSKNNKQIWWKKTKSGKKVPFITDSERVKKYRRFAEEHFLKLKKRFKELSSDKEYPLKVEFFFIKQTRVRFDYNNATHIITDLMVEYGWIPNDDARHLKPIPGGFDVNKSYAGVFLKIL